MVISGNFTAISGQFSSRIWGRQSELVPDVNPRGSFVVSVSAAARFLRSSGVIAGFLGQEDDASNNYKYKKRGGIKPTKGQPGICDRFVYEISQCRAQRPREDERAPK